MSNEKLECMQRSYLAMWLKMGAEGEDTQDEPAAATEETRWVRSPGHFKAYLKGYVFGLSPWSKSPLGSAPARPLHLLSARLVALGGSSLPERGPATAHWSPSHRLGGSQASCLQSRRFHCLFDHPGLLLFGGVAATGFLLSLKEPATRLIDPTEDSEDLETTPLLQSFSPRFLNDDLSRMPLELDDLSCMSADA